MREVGVLHHVYFASNGHAVVSLVFDAQARDAVALLHDEQLATAVESEAAGFSEVAGDELGFVSWRKGWCRVTGL